MGLQKNVSSQKWLVFAFNRTNNTPLTGDAANITAKIRKDYGTATATNDVNPTEIEDGYYEFDLTQAETSADVLDLLPESSTSDIQVIGVPGRIFTVPSAFADNPTLTSSGAQSACNSALVALGLDHLVGAAVSGTDVVDDSIIAKLVSKNGMADWDTFSNTTDSLEALRDQGDLAWITATGFSTHTAANVRTEMDANSTQLAAIVADTNALQTDWADGGRLDLILDAILVDTGTTLDGKINTIDTIVDAILADTGTDGVVISSTHDLYHADIDMAKDDTNSQDEYCITWFKNGVRQTSGITSPTIQVVKYADGTDLIASSTPTEIGSTGSYKHVESTNRITAGEPVLVIVGATIDSAARTFSRLIKRDSS